MKKTSNISRWWISLFPIILIIGQNSLQAQSEINEIGSFEQQFPSYWMKGAEPVGSALEWATDQYRSMNKSLKITKQATAEAAVWESDYMQDLWSPLHYKNIDMLIGAYVKTEGVNTNPANDDQRWYISYSFYNQSGNLIRETILPINQSVSTSSGWTADTNGVGQTILQEDSWKTIIKFVGGKDATGTVWADDFILIGRNDAWAGQDWNTSVEMPTGWNYWLPPNGGNDGKFDSGFENTVITTEQAYTGLHSLKFDLPFNRAKHDAWVGTKRYPINADAGDVYRISVWIKASNLVPDSAAVDLTMWSVGLTPIFHSGYLPNDTYDEIGAQDMVFQFPAVTSFDWTKYYADVTVPDNPNVKSLSVRIHIYAKFTGTIYFDKLEVEKMDIPEITLMSPNGGEGWQSGSAQNITWTSTNVDNVKLEYTTDNGTNWTTVIASTPASTGSYSWTIPNTPSTTCKVRISDVSNSAINDISDVSFSIIPGVNITFQVDMSTQVVKGIFNATKDTVYLRGTFTNWVTSDRMLKQQNNIYTLTKNLNVNTNYEYKYFITSSGAINGGWEGTVGTGGDGNRVLQTENTDYTIPVVYFNNEVSAISIISPNGGESWLVGSSHNITWILNGVTNFKIEYTTNGGISWIQVIASTTANNGSFTWTVPNTPSANCKVRISDASNSTINDVSNNVFTIYQPSITVTSPNGLENWQVGTTHGITWTSTNVSNVKIDYTTDNGTNWISVITSTPASTRSYSWIIPNTPSTSCRVRISDVSNSAIKDVSYNVFTIFKPSIALTSPNGGENWTAGTAHNITWTSSNVTNVKLEYTTNNGTDWSTIITSTPASTGSYSWTVPNTPSTNCKVRISDVSNSAINDVSDNNFTIIGQFTEQTSISLKGVSNSSVAWGDYDNDGDLDILLTGSTVSGGGVSKIYKNNGNGTFTEQTSILLTGVNSGSAAWGDYNNDGYIDILLTGESDIGRISKIYKNNSNGTFTEQTSISLTAVTQSSVGWGDYDNDGDLDILLTGNNSPSDTPVSKIYKNNGNGTFTEQTSISLTGVGGCSVAWGDYDNDGDLDVLLTGLSTGTIQKSKIYKNNGNGTFTEQTSISLTGVNASSVAWGDYDNDGDLDILLTGWTGADNISKIYKNNGNGTFTEQTSISLTGVGGCSVAWGDYDNDGDLDILLTGNSPGSSGGVPASKIYKNNANGTFTEQSSISLTGVRFSSVAWGDYDNDGDLDILLTGESDNGKIAKIYKNNNIIFNSIPTTPTNLNSTVSGSNVTFNWNKSTDNKTPQNGLHYNLVIGTAPNSVNTLSPMADKATGFRRVVRLGNSQTNSWTIKNLPGGEYYWSVQAIDNAFAGSQFASEQTFNFQSIAITLPNGGENWQVGSQHNITWTSSNISNVKIEYSTDNGSTWILIIASTSASLGSYSWTIPNTPSTQCSVRISDITDAAITDVSDNAFTIFDSSTSTAVLLTPNGGESWQAGSYHNITWVTNKITNVKLEYSTNNGTSWLQIIESVPNLPNNYTWNIPNTPSEQCIVRISDASNPLINDVSNNTFTISEVLTPGIVITAPNGGENWEVGSQQNITWASNSVANVKIDYTNDSGTNWIEIIASTPAASGSYSWTIPNTPSTNCKVRLSDAANLSTKDESENLFSIFKPSITVTVPNGGEQWQAGTQQSINWMNNNVDSVKIEFTSDSGANWMEIIQSTETGTGGGGCSWLVPNTPSSNCKVRISDVDNALINDISDNDFTIIPQSTITVLSPNGGESRQAGTTENITWVCQGVANVKLEYTADNDTNWITINESVSANSGAYSWVVPNTPSDNCRVRISNTDNSAINDVSNNVFTIVALVTNNRSVYFNGVKGLLYVTDDAPANPDADKSGYIITGNKITVEAWVYPISLPELNHEFPIVRRPYLERNPWCSYTLFLPNPEQIDNPIFTFIVTNGDSLTPQAGVQFNNPLSKTWTHLAGTYDGETVRLYVNGNLVGENPYTQNLGTGDTGFIIGGYPGGGNTFHGMIDEVRLWNVARTQQQIKSYLNNVLIGNEEGLVGYWPLDSTYTGSNSLVTPDKSKNHNDLYVYNAAFIDASAQGGAINISSPSVATESVSNYDFFDATLVGYVNPNGISTNVFFEYGETTNYDNKIDAFGSPFGGNGVITVNADIDSLEPGKTYHYRVVATNTLNETQVGDDKTFTTKTYPTSISVSQIFSFGDVLKTESYKMIGLPGNNNLPMTSVIDGEFNKDWIAYMDDGSGGNNYLIKYDGSDQFNFTPGNAFWVLSKNQVNINTLVTTVPLNASYCLIPLNQNGWTQISNPFEINVSWNLIKNLNSITQPIHYFENGSYSEADLFEPYKGYYFANTSNLSSLKIPYKKVSNLNLLKKELASESDSVEISFKLTLYNIQGLKKEIAISFNSNSSDSLDKYDIIAPPGDFETTRLAVYNESIPNYKYFIRDSRKEIGTGQEYRVELKNKSENNIKLFAETGKALKNFEIFLIDESTFKFYNLKEVGSLVVNSFYKAKCYKLLIGNKEYIETKKKSLTPKEFVLYQNFPNPFNPVTQINFSLPEKAFITLKVFNILGKEVSTLVNEEKPAGFYEVAFDGSSIGGGLSTGIYFYRLQAEKFVDTKKFILLK